MCTSSQLRLINSDQKIHLLSHNEPHAAVELVPALRLSKMGNGSRSHHLLKHALPEVDVKEHFGSIEPKEITREINRLGQRDLQVRRSQGFRCHEELARSCQSSSPEDCCLFVIAGQIPGCVWHANVLKQQQLAPSKAVGRYGVFSVCFWPNN